jgi:hypothetical protein
MSERGLVMLAHSTGIGLLLYIFMVYVMQQKPLVAEDRTIVIAAIILIYMLTFGHEMPSTNINKNLVM